MEEVFQIKEDFVESLVVRTLNAIDAFENERAEPRRLIGFYRNLSGFLKPFIGADRIKEIIQISLQASLEREEGSFNDFSVVLEPPDLEYDLEQFVFESPLPFSVNNLKKLAPAINSNKYHIGIWMDGENLEIWGFKQNVISFLTIGTLSPGKLVYRCLSTYAVSFKCLITLYQFGVINPMMSDTPLRMWIGVGDDVVKLQKLVDLHYLIGRIFDMGKGGAVLLTKGNHSAFRNSLSQPLKFSIKTPSTESQFPQIHEKYKFWEEFKESARLNRKLDEDQKAAFRNEFSLRALEARNALDSIAQLSTVDGAVVLNENLSLICFGAKIRLEATKERQLYYRHAYAAELAPTGSSNCGGMRHQSAISFVSEQHDCVAIVISEDKRISLFYWDEKEDAVVQIRNYELIAVQ